MSSGSGDQRLIDFRDRMMSNGDTVYAGLEDWYGTPIIEGEGHYYQWDKNQKLLILIPNNWNPLLSWRMYSPTGSFTEVQAAEAAFGYPNQEVYRKDAAPKSLGRLITRSGFQWLEFEVPNSALEKSGEMWAYITVTSEHHTMTEFIVKIRVLPRVKPEPYQSLNDPDSVAKVLALLIDARDRAEAAADKAEQEADRAETEANRAKTEADRSSMFADNAAASAAAAARSASQAATSASNAANSASQAAASASAANTAKIAAQNAQIAAEDAKRDAQSYANIAQNQAGLAKGYAEDAEDYYNRMVGAGTTIEQIETRVDNLETCCTTVKGKLPFDLEISGGKYGYKDTGGSFHPFKYPSGTLTLTGNTGSSGVSTEYGTDGAYYEKVVVDVPEGPGPTVHTTTYTPVAENNSGSGNDMGESHSHRYVNTSGFYKVNQGTKNITANGSYDITHYSNVSVNVPSSGITPSGTKSITANGTYDVTQYANAEVDVPAADPVETIVNLNDYYVYDYISYSRLDSDGRYRWPNYTLNGSSQLYSLKPLNAKTNMSDHTTIFFEPRDHTNVVNTDNTPGDLFYVDEGDLAFLACFMPDSFIMTRYIGNDYGTSVSFTSVVDNKYYTIPESLRNIDGYQQVAGLILNGGGSSSNYYGYFVYSDYYGKNFLRKTTASGKTQSSAIYSGDTVLKGATCLHCLINPHPKSYYASLNDTTKIPGLVYTPKSYFRNLFLVNPG